MNVPYRVKYGENVVTKQGQEARFRVKYGEVVFGCNLIDMPLDPEKPDFSRAGSTEFYNRKVTIYNDIPATAVEARHFDRFVILMCNIQGGSQGVASNTVTNNVNTQTVITKDITRYKPPTEYYKLPVDQRENYYTINIGDFVVFGEVDDEVTDAASYAQLQKKYNVNGFKVTTTAANIYEMGVDNISMANA